MPAAFQFDPDKVAYFETAGWKAYYDRNWLRAFTLMVRLNREQFAMSWPAAVGAAVDVVRASMAFAPVENDLPRTRRFLARFYDKARRHVHLGADAATAAGLELDYWVVHRRLALERQQHPEAGNLEPLVASLLRLHAVLFDAPAAAIRASAEARACAAEAVDRITGGYSVDVDADWVAVEENLRLPYRAVLPAQGSPSMTGNTPATTS